MQVSRTVSRIYLLIPAVLVLFACSGETDSVVRRQNGRISITDQTGREWDVTHAVETYDMDPEFFNFGIGVGAIPSIDNPVELIESDPGYPEENDNRDVFGLVINGIPRAYGVNTLVRHEVFNETFKGATVTYAAVSY